MELNVDNTKFTVGELLKKVRQEKGFTVAEVVRITKIRFSYIELIESNNYNKLPERTYVLGYIHSYSKFLDLDYKAIVKQAELEYELRDPLYKNMVQNNRLDKKYNPINVIKENIIDFIFILLSFGFKRYGDKKENLNTDKKSFKLPIILFVILATVIVIFVGIFIVKNNREISIENPPVVISGNVANNLDLQKLQNDNSKDNNSKSFIKSSDMVVVSKYNTDNKSPYNNDNDLSDNKNSQKIYSWPSSNKESNITLLFNADVWVKIYNQENNNIVYLDAIFKKGQSFKVPNVPNLLMDTGDYKGMYLMVNNNIIYLSSNTSIDVLKKIPLVDEDLLKQYLNE